MPMAEISGARRYDVPQRPVGEALDRPAVERGQRHRDQQHQEQRERDRGHPDRHQRQERDQRDEGADHEHVAVGEVDHADDAVDHRVADGDQAVDRAERDAVDELLKEIFHASDLSPGRAPNLAECADYPGILRCLPGAGRRATAGAPERRIRTAVSPSLAAPPACRRQETQAKLAAKCTAARADAAAMKGNDSECPCKSPKTSSVRRGRSPARSISKACATGARSTSTASASPTSPRTPPSGMPRAPSPGSMTRCTTPSRRTC